MFKVAILFLVLFSYIVYFIFYIIWVLLLSRDNDKTKHIVKRVKRVKRGTFISMIIFIIASMIFCVTFNEVGILMLALMLCFFYAISSITTYYIL